jgi:acetyl esterase/lipase
MPVAAMRIPANVLIVAVRARSSRMGTTLRPRRSAPILPWLPLVTLSTPGVRPSRWPVSQHLSQPKSRQSNPRQNRDKDQLTGRLPTDEPEILTRSSPRPDAVLRYGPHRDHVADLRLPGLAGGGQRQWGPGTPLVIFLHGGFWRAAYDRTHTGPLATALAAEGFAVCTPEFRRCGQAGGGWPGTFDDVALAVDTVPGLVAAELGARADSRKVVLAGHSAGGHLALWAAARHRLSPAAPWHAAETSVVGVVALAAVSDLASCYAQGLGGGAVTDLLGGGPDDQPERYALADPSRPLPARIPVRLVHGAEDTAVPCAMSQTYAARANAAGDDVTCAVLPGSDHFDVIDPMSSAWPHVVAAFRALCSSEPPRAPG